MGFAPVMFWSGEGVRPHSVVWTGPLYISLDLSQKAERCPCTVQNGAQPLPGLEAAWQGLRQERGSCSVVLPFLWLSCDSRTPGPCACVPPLPAAARWPPPRSMQRRSDTVLQWDVAARFPEPPEQLWTPGRSRGAALLTELCSVSPPAVPSQPAASAYVFRQWEDCLVFEGVDLVFCRT